MWAGGTASQHGCEDSGEPIDYGYDLKKHEQHTRDMGLELLSYLNKNAHRAAIVARAGGDISDETFRNPPLQKYTHAGIVWKGSDDARWKFMHVLNICAGETSEIFIQSLVQFFNDDPYYYDFYVGVPSKEFQEKIADVLESNVARKLHNSQYSNIANPFNTVFQNSNTWVLNILASAQSGKNTINGVQDHYVENSYSPSQVEIGFFRGIGASFVPNVSLSDHPSGNGGWFDFVSAASLFKYLEQTDYQAVSEEVCLYKGCNLPLKVINN